MIREFGLATIDLGCLNELLPALVSEEAKEAQAPSAPQMSVDLRCRLLVLLKERFVCQRGCMLDQDLLRGRGLEMHLLDEGEQFLPSLPVGAAIFSRVDSRQFPSLAAGKDIDRLLELDCDFLQRIRGNMPVAAPPKVGTELVVPLFQACPFK